MGRALQQRLYNVWLAATINGRASKSPHLSAGKNVYVSANSLFPLSEVFQFILPEPVYRLSVLVFDPILPHLLL